MIRPGNFLLQRQVLTIFFFSKNLPLSLLIKIKWSLPSRLIITTLYKLVLHNSITGFMTRSASLPPFVPSTIIHKPKHVSLGGSFGNTEPGQGNKRKARDNFKSMYIQLMHSEIHYSNTHTFNSTRYSFYG